MDAICFKVPRLKEETIRVECWDLPYFYDPIHFHQDYQISYILEGQGTIIAGNYIGKFKEGDLYLIGENISHVLRHEEKYYQDGSQLHAKAISIFFPQSPFNKIFKEIPELNSLNNLLEQAMFGIHLTPIEAARIVPIIHRIHNQKGVNRILSFLAILNGIAESKKMELLCSTTPNLYGKDENLKLKKVFSYITDHYHESIRLEKIAGLTSMTPTAFCRFFKMRTNRTLSSFLIDVRINQACKLLTDGNSNVMETYIACGYNNGSNFHRHFKRITGLTPREFKTKTRQKQSIYPVNIP
jgi:AraC-like DNA-binding protein